METTTNNITYTTYDLARQAAREEWSRRVMEGVVGSPNSHADAIAVETLLAVGKVIWNVAYAQGALDERMAIVSEIPEYPHADRVNPFEGK